MEKRAALSGILSKMTKVPIKKISNRKRLFFRNVLEYLRSDSYMFALLSSPASLVGSENSPSLTIDMKGKGKKLTKKVEEYLKSDTYMYAPLCDPQQHVASHKGYTSNVKRINMEISTKKLIVKDNQSTMESSNVTVEHRLREAHLSEASNELRKKLPRKSLKHKIYNFRSSSSVSGNEICHSQPGNLLVANC